MICSGGSLQNKVISGKKTNMQDMRLRVDHQHVAHTIPSSLGRRPIHALPQISIGYVFLSLPYTNISIFVFNVRTYGCTAKKTEKVNLVIEPLFVFAVAMMTLTLSNIIHIKCHCHPVRRRIIQ